MTICALCAGPHWDSECSTPPPRRLARALLDELTEVGERRVRVPAPMVSRRVVGSMDQHPAMVSQAVVEPLAPFTAPVRRRPAPIPPAPFDADRARLRALEAI